MLWIKFKLFSAIICSVVVKFPVRFSVAFTILIIRALVCFRIIQTTKVLSPFMHLYLFCSFLIIFMLNSTFEWHTNTWMYVAFFFFLAWFSFRGFLFSSELGFGIYCLPVNFFEICLLIRLDTKHSYNAKLLKPNEQ